jgi:hypothetical protein
MRRRVFFAFGREVPRRFSAAMRLVNWFPKIGACRVQFCYPARDLGVCSARPVQHFGDHRAFCRGELRRALREYGLHSLSE